MASSNPCTRDATAFETMRDVHSIDIAQASADPRVIHARIST
jgi:hypothetical protein